MTTEQKKAAKLVERYKALRAEGWSYAAAAAAVSCIRGFNKSKVLEFFHGDPTVAADRTQFHGGCEDMKADIRETEIWNRSADQHEKNGEPVAAILSRHLAWQAQQARNEYIEVAKLAEAQHLAAQEIYEEAH